MAKKKLPPVVQTPTAMEEPKIPKEKKAKVPKKPKTPDATNKKTMKSCTK